jgi:hypothetical protein
MPGQTQDSDNIGHKTQNKDKQRPKKKPQLKKL